MLGYLPKVKVIKNLTQSPRGKHLTRFATTPTFLQCLEDPSLKDVFLPSLDLCLDKQDPPEGGVTSSVLIVTPSSKRSEHCGYVYPLHLPCIYIFTHLS